MANIIKPKSRSADATAPTVDVLADGEIAVNSFAKRIFQRVGTEIVVIANYFGGAFADLSGKPTTLAGYGISDAQAKDATLTALAGLDTAANRIPYFTGTDSADLLTLSTDGTLAANSDTAISTQRAVRAYIDSRSAATDAMVFKGVIDCSTSPNYPAADNGWTYRVSVAGKIGGAAGPSVEAGDILICTANGTAAGDQAAVGALWAVIQANIDGALTTASIGVTVHPYDPGLAGLTAQARALLDDPDAAAQRATLGLGTAATAATADFAPVSHGHAIENITGLQAALDARLSKSGGVMTGSLDMQTSATKYNKTQFFSPATATDVLNVRRYGADYTLLNMMAPPQTSWGGAREATLALVRGDNNEYFLDLYNMDYGSTPAGDYLNWGNPKMGMRLQKRGTGVFTPFYIEYSDGVDEVRAIEILPRASTGLTNDTQVNIPNLLTVNGNEAFHAGNLSFSEDFSLAAGVLSLASSLPSLIAFDAARKGSSVALTDDDTSAAPFGGSSISGVALAGNSLAPADIAGFYQEFVLAGEPGSGNRAAVGLASEDHALDVWLGGGDSIGFHSGSGTWYGDSSLGYSLDYFSGDTVMVAAKWDAASGKVRAWFGVNGVWINSGDPAAGTGYYSFTPPAGAAGYSLAVGWDGAPTTAKFTIKQPAAFGHTAPAGFTAGWPIPAASEDGGSGGMAVVFITSSTTATPNTLYMCDAGTGNSLNLTLPPTLKPGDKFAMQCISGAAVMVSNGNVIERVGAGNDLALADGESFSIIATGANAAEPHMAGAVGPQGPQGATGATGPEGSTKGAPIEEVTATSYIFAITDTSKFKKFNNASAQTATIPPQSSVAWQDNAQIECVQVGAGLVTVAAGEGVTIRRVAGLGLSTAGQNSVFGLKRLGVDEWVLFGQMGA